MPAIQYESLKVSLPVLSVSGSDVVAYSALGSTQPPVPASASWPSGCVFAATDAAALTQAAGIPFPLGPEASFDWDIVSGKVEAQVHAPTDLSVNADGSLSASIVADALAQLTLHMPDPFPNVSFGPKAQATLAVTFQPSVVANEVRLAIEGVPIPDFSFDWGLPGWVNWVFDPIEAGLAAALNKVLGPLIGKALTFPPIPVFSLPTVKIPIGGKSVEITLDQAKTSAEGDMLVVEAQVGVG